MRDKCDNGKNLLVTTLILSGAVFFLCCGDAPIEAVYPVERARVGFVRRVWSRVSGMVRASSVATENVRLRREVALLAMAAGDVERLEAENARLRAALGYASGRHNEWLPAAILSDGASSSVRSSRLRADCGSIAGVREGAVVATPDGIVGVVTAVTPHTSEITTVADRSVEVSCELESGGGLRSHGILSGGTDELLTLKYLTGSLDVPARSRVVTSGRGGVFPKGLEVGTLVSLKRDSAGSPVAADVQPSVDFATLEDVFIRREK